MKNKCINIVYFQKAETKNNEQSKVIYKFSNSSHNRKVSFVALFSSEYTIDKIVKKKLYGKDFEWEKSIKHLKRG